MYNKGFTSIDQTNKQQKITKQKQSPKQQLVVMAKNQIKIKNKQINYGH